MDKTEEKELKKLAKRKDVNAMIKLADMYGGILNKKGLKLYIKAAKLNSVKAQSDLAVYYYSYGYAPFQVGKNYAADNIGTSFGKAKK